jgi:hypothetical protein
MKVRRRREAFGEVAVLEADMAVTEKARWFRFSVRTILVAFAVAAFWLGWNSYVVQQRKDALESLVDAGGTAIRFNSRIAGIRHNAEGAIVAYTRDGADWTTVKEYQPRAWPSVSTLRQWLGDDGHWIVICNGRCDSEHMRALFPEATVLVEQE